jgi:hypothetical protein
MMNSHDVAARILADVYDRFGIEFSDVGTGGGAMALEARLESGHWIVATDENLSSFVRRIEGESFPDNYNVHYGDDHVAMGWSVGVYVNDPAENTWMSSGVDSIVDIVDYDAYADALPEIVGRALAALAQRRAAVIDEYSVDGGARIRVRRPGYYY